MKATATEAAERSISVEDALRLRVALLPLLFRAYSSCLSKSERQVVFWNRPKSTGLHSRPA
jgi:hypothetical protein